MRDVAISYNLCSYGRASDVGRWRCTRPMSPTLTGLAVVRSAGRANMALRRAPVTESGVGAVVKLIDLLTWCLRYATGMTSGAFGVAQLIVPDRHWPTDVGHSLIRWLKTPDRAEMMGRAKQEEVGEIRSAQLPYERQAWPMTAQLTPSVLIRWWGMIQLGDWYQ